MKTSRSGLAALFFVYFVWGSSFLAIRLAVSGDGAFAPYTLAAVRTFVAGVVLLACGLAQGAIPRMSAAAFRWLALTGTLLWVGGHALVIFAERRMDSGLAALIFASTPLWAALLEGARGKTTVRPLPVLAGFAGVVIVLPLGAGMRGDLWFDGAVLLLSAFLWALGTVLGEGPAKGLPITVSTGTQLTVAGVVTAAWAFAAGESMPAPAPRALGAAVYLTLIGTVLAYLAYVHAARRLPVPWLMSFGYVNPVVAVVLGALVLGEKIGVREGFGMVIVVASVAWLFAVPAQEVA